MMVFYEPTCRGKEHILFNLGLVETALRAYPEDRTIFWGEAAHLRELQGQLDVSFASRVEWREMTVAPRDLYDARRRLPWEWRVCEQVLQSASSFPACTVLGCSSNSASLLALKALLATRFRRLHVVVVQHSILAEAERRVTRFGFRRPSLYELCLRWGSNARLRYIVLSEFLRRETVRLLPNLQRQVFALRMICHFPAAEPDLTPSQAPLRFGFLGVATIRKGFPDFCRLARDIRQRQARPEAHRGSSPPRFELAGCMIDPSMPENLESMLGFPVTEFVELEPGFEFLPLDAYQRRVADLTYAVLPYQRDKSTLIASAAVFDAFSFAKPCIAYRTPVFEELFQDMGDIGYLCDGFEEMRDLVTSLVENPPADRYARQRANILQGRRMFEPSALAESLRAILDFGPERCGY